MVVLLIEGNYYSSRRYKGVSRTCKGGLGSMFGGWLVTHCSRDCREERVFRSGTCMFCSMPVMIVHAGAMSTLKSNACIINDDVHSYIPVKDVERVDCHDRRLPAAPVSSQVGVTHHDNSPKDAQDSDPTPQTRNPFNDNLLSPGCRLRQMCCEYLHRHRTKLVRGRIQEVCGLLAFGCS